MMLDKFADNRTIALYVNELVARVEALEGKHERAIDADEFTAKMGHKPLMDDLETTVLQHERRLVRLEALEADANPPRDRSGDEITVWLREEASEWEPDDPDYSSPISARLIEAADLIDRLREASQGKAPLPDGEYERATSRECFGFVDVEPPPEITPAMITAGIRASQTERFRDSVDRIKAIYRAMEAKKGKT